MAWADVLTYLQTALTNVTSAEGQLPAVDSSTGSVADGDRLAAVTRSNAIDRLLNIIQKLQRILSIVENSKQLSADDIKQRERDAILNASDRVYSLTKDSNGYPVTKTWTSVSLGKRATITYTYSVVDGVRNVSGTSLSITTL